MSFIRRLAEAFTRATLKSPRHSAHLDHIGRALNATPGEPPQKAPFSLGMSALAESFRRYRSLYAGEVADLDRWADDGGRCA